MVKWDEKMKSEDQTGTCPLMDSCSITLGTNDSQDLGLDETDKPHVTGGQSSVAMDSFRRAGAPGLPPTRRPGRWVNTRTLEARLAREQPTREGQANHEKTRCSHTKNPGALLGKTRCFDGLWGPW